MHLVTDTPPDASRIATTEDYLYAFRTAEDHERRARQARLFEETCELRAVPNCGHYSDGTWRQDQRSFANLGIEHAIPLSFHADKPIIGNGLVARGRRLLRSWGQILGLVPDPYGDSYA